MHEHVAHAMYYFSIHLLCASAVGVAAWALCAIRSLSATAKYWIWVATTLNFFVPAGFLIDQLWARQIPWAGPLGAIGGPVWDMTQSWTGVILAFIWIAGALAMLARLAHCIRRDRVLRRSTASPAGACVSSFMAGGIPVNFDLECSAPAVTGIFSSRIVLPTALDRLLDRRELDAVLLHEVAHARRRDNLLWLFYEISLCALWFHPLVWLAGARMAVYRELSCDESVIHRGLGGALVSALAKLAAPRRRPFLEAAAASHLTHRLACLAHPPQAPRRTGDFLLSALFAAVIAASIFQTVVHTACCFG